MVMTRYLRPIRSVFAVGLLCLDDPFSSEAATEIDKRLTADIQRERSVNHPDSPLIPKVMIRINEFYYLKENYLVAARVSGKFIERFPEQELASRMAFHWAVPLQTGSPRRCSGAI